MRRGGQCAPGIFSRLGFRWSVARVCMCVRAYTFAPLPFQLKGAAAELGRFFIRREEGGV